MNLIIAVTLTGIIYAQWFPSIGRFHGIIHTFQRRNLKPLDIRLRKRLRKVIKCWPIWVMMM